MIEVVNLESLDYSEKAIQIWKAAGFVYKVVSYEDLLLQNCFSNSTILIVRLSYKVNEDILCKFPNLKYLLSPTTGTDHIDLSDLDRRQIKLISLKGHNDFLKTIPSTAELAWGLILSLVRKVPSAYNDVLKGNWYRDRFKGNQLFNKTIGIVGLGRTGSLVAKYAEVFGMKVGYYDPFILCHNVYQKYDTIEDLLKESDIVSIHVHLTDKTIHLINHTNINYCRQNSFIINTSRGKIIENKAITEALINNKIHGYAADVLYDEFLLDKTNDDLILLMKKGHNIILTPHIGGATYEAMQMCEEYLASYLVNLISYEKNMHV